jgi:hypothetical protein
MPAMDVAGFDSDDDDKTGGEIKDTSAGRQRALAVVDGGLRSW